HLTLPRASRSSLFPYTTLFRSTSVTDASVSAHNPTSGTGMVSDSSIGPNPNQYTVNLKNVSTGQYITVTLNIVTDRAGNNSNVVDRKSTRLNSSHVAISYAVFC